MYLSAEFSSKEKAAPELSFVRAIPKVLPALWIPPLSGIHRAELSGDFSFKEKSPLESSL